MIGTRVNHNIVRLRWDRCIECACPLHRKTPVGVRFRLEARKSRRGTDDFRSTQAGWQVGMFLECSPATAQQFLAIRELSEEVLYALL